MIDEKLWDKKADEGNGLYAIALAILDLSASVDRLGLNYKSTAGTTGTTERIAIELDDIGHSLARIAQAMGDSAP